MSVVQPGGEKGPGQKPSPGQKPPGQGPGSGPRPGQKPGQRPPSSVRRPPSAKPGSGTPPRGGGRPPAGKGAGKGQTARRPATPVPATAPRRFTPATMAYAVIVVVVLAIVALVVVKVTGGSNNNSGGGGSTISSAPPSLVSQVTSVPLSLAAQVGTPASAVVAPKLDAGQAPLTKDGKPEALFIGAEFCPLCGAERWAIVMAFSRFGTWSNLDITTSSQWDTPPAIATFTFRNATFTSQYVSLTTVEHETNDTHGLGTRQLFQPLTSQEQSLWSTYSAHFGVRTGYPFLDIGNKVFVTGPSYSPYVLEGLDHTAIASKLTNPGDQVTQGIVGTANYITAGLCAVTGGQPGSVCSAPAITAASKAMNTGS